MTSKKTQQTERQQLRAHLQNPPKPFGCANCGYGPCGCDEANESRETNLRRSATRLFALVRGAKPTDDDQADLALVNRFV